MLGNGDLALSFPLTDRSVAIPLGLSIYDDDTVKWWEPEELRQEMCGSTIPSDIESTSDTLLITWSSDESRSFKGFKLQYALK